MKWTTFLRVLPGALIPVCALLSPGGLAQAQTVRHGDVEIGQRGLAGDRASSKFQEYRQLPTGLFLNRLHLNIENQGRYLQLRAIRAAQEDQRVLLGLGQYGRVRLDLEWDQTPHLLSTTGRTLFAQSQSSVFGMPLQTRQDLNKLVTTDTNPSQAGVQPDLAALGNLINGAARGVDLSTQRKTGKASLRYTPAQEWDVRVQYSIEDRSGAKPLGANFGFNLAELPEPVDYRTQEFRVSSEYADRRWDARFDYSASLFNNSVDAMIWDNPFVTANAVGSPSRGRLGIFPDNTAQNVAFSGAVNLPRSTRLATTLSYGWRRQNAPFLPFTINSAVAALSNYPALPATSLNGAVNTVLTNVALTSRPARNLSLTGRYRYYDYDNRTPSLLFPKYISYDTQLSGDARRSLPIAYTRQNAGLDLGYQFVKGASLKLGYGWENWDRTHRDARKVDEKAFQTALNLTPADWLALRTSYTRSARKTHEYDAEEHVAHETFPQGESGLGQHPDLRKFDMASRDRDRVEAMAQVTPVEALSFSASAGYANDDFVESAYGLQGDRNANVSFDVSYSPTERFTLFAGYTWEDYKYQQKSRQRTPASGSNPANDKPANDWLSNMGDAVNTVNAGLSGSLIPRKLDLDIDYSVSKAEGTTQTRTPGTPDIVTTAQDYPDTHSRLHQAAATLRYHLSASVVPRFEYRYERYSSDYFYRTNLSPFMGAVDASTTSAAFLGATQPDYRAHIVSFVIGYTF